MLLRFLLLVISNSYSTSEHVLLLFSAHLASAGLTYSTIKAYLSAVQNLHVTAECHAAYSRALTPCLEQVLRGIKKEDLQSTFVSPLQLK